jgi:hypothetical protein
MSSAVHWIVTAIELVLGHIPRGAVLTFITVAAVVLAWSIATFAIKRHQPRTFDLWLLLVAVCLLLLVMLTYSGAARMLGV